MCKHAILQSSEQEELVIQAFKRVSKKGKKVQTENQNETKRKNVDRSAKHCQLITVKIQSHQPVVLKIAVAT